LYLTSIAVFGVSATEVIRLPIIELAKSVEIPGGFFERMESVFFVIWVTAIFTTAMMAFDVAVLALHSIFSKVNKRSIIFSLAPFIFFISLIPDDYLEMRNVGDVIAYYNYGLSVFVVLLLWIMYGVRGGKQHGK
jgi:spore germination protein